MRKAMLIVQLVIVTSTQTYAQMRQMVWPLPNAWDTMTLTFNGGYSYGTKLLLDFHTTPPTLLELPHDTLYGPDEAISSICNRWGQLQFYSDNHRVWSGSHELVENIDNLHSYIPDNRSVFSTVANATMILPFPGDSLDRYFSLWTMDYQSTGMVPLYLQHSLIDRYGGTTGNGILLDQGKPHRALGDTQIQESLTAIKHANGRDWWIICRKGTTNSDTIISLLFTPKGIEAINYFHAPLSSSWIGLLKPSNDGVLLAENLYNEKKINIYKFDRCYGRIEHTHTFYSPNNKWLAGMSFSANDKYLYVGSNEPPLRLYQLKLIDDTIHHVNLIYSLNGSRLYGQLSLGPDDKIYCIQGNINSNHYINTATDPFMLHMGVIQNPNNEGSACNYNPAGFYLNGHFLYGGGLPNHPNYDLGPLRGSICDSLPDPVIASVPIQALPEVFSVNAYPNPASGTLMLSATGGTLSSLQVFNALGQLQWRLDDASPQQSVSVEDWPPGIYTIVARASSGALSKRQVMIQR